MLGTEEAFWHTAVILKETAQTVHMCRALCRTVCVGGTFACSSVPTALVAPISAVVRDDVH